MPPTKSMNSCPSTSTMRAPCARSTNTGAVATDADTHRSRSAISAAVRAPTCSLTAMEVLPSLAEDVHAQDSQRGAVRCAGVDRFRATWHTTRLVLVHDGAPTYP